MAYLKKGSFMETGLFQKLSSKKITKAELFQKVEADFSLLTELLNGTSSSKAAVRYGCGKVLMDLSEKYPEMLYPYMENFIGLLDSKYRILTWNAMAIIANLTAVDVESKFDAALDKYYSYLGNEYMVTVANLVGNSAKIVSAKPYLADKIAAELLKVQNLKTTPHLTEECKLVIAEHAIKTFNTLINYAKNKEQLIAFTKKHIDSSRLSLSKEAQEFLKKYG
jgi:hypothetical protein